MCSRSVGVLGLKTNGGVMNLDVAKGGFNAQGTFEMFLGNIPEIYLESAHISASVRLISDNQCFGTAALIHKFMFNIYFLVLESRGS